MMIWRFLLLACCTAFMLTVYVNGETGNTMEIEHAFGGGDWSKRSELSLSIDSVKKKIALKFASNTYEFNEDELTAFKQLLGANGFYRVRIRAASGGDAWMIASIPACSLAGNRFRETFRFHIDKTGALLGFDYIPLTQSTDCGISGLKSIKLLSKASASIPQDAHAVPANAVATSDADLMKRVQQPDAAAAPPKEGKEGKEGEEAEPEPGFLRKYWYVFVPLALMSILAPPSEEGAPAGAGAQDGGARPAVGGGGGKKKK